MEGHARSCKVMQGHGRSCKVMEDHGKWSCMTWRCLGTSRTLSFWFVSAQCLVYVRLTGPSFERIMRIVFSATTLHNALRPLPEPLDTSLSPALANALRPSPNPADLQPHFLLPTIMLTWLQALRLIPTERRTHCLLLLTHHLHCSLC